MRDQVSSKHNPYPEIWRKFSSTLHHLLPLHPLPLYRALQLDFNLPLHLPLLFSIWAWSLPRPSHATHKSVSYYPRTCSVWEWKSQTLLPSNRKYWDHRLSHPNSKLFPRRISLSRSKIIIAVLTSISLRMPSGTGVSGSAVHVVPRSLCGFSGWMWSFRSFFTSHPPKNVLTLERRNLIGAYGGGALTTGLFS